ncbi:MAG TPA: filamentous hemagglutinin N-terminal domain-containing protein, partial [Verrucomicrobiae bacterium]|nr:filamentous hemagglutinin N-terminal domain-containing protein [Verrucomicrobiae bacterium]
MNRTAQYLVLAATISGFAALGNPAGMTVQHGSASAVTSGNQLTITASQNAFLNWQSFNIGAGETTRFLQPSASSVVWNQINDQNPSQIYGNLNANGIVVLMNRSGFYFGPGSFVSAAGLVVTTAPAAPADSSAGLFWQFNGAPPQASIVNYGQLNVGTGGSLFLIGEHVENHGTLNAPQGNIGLVAGQEVLLSERPDGRGLASTVRLPSGSVDNDGRIVADAGSIALNAQVVNQNGLLQANSIREQNGVIELVASDAISLGAQSTISADGGPTASSGGGLINIKAGNSFADSSSSRISVAGSDEGGPGGRVEISAPQMASVHSMIDGHANSGSTGGRLLIDPQDIVLGASGSGSASSGTIGATEPPTSGALNLDVNSAFVGFSQIDLQATRNITLSSGVTWDLYASTGINSPGSLLKLEAGNNITIGSGASISAGNGWSVTLQAGRNFSSPDAIQPGLGNISFSGTGSLQAQDGNIQLLAGNNITVSSGFVRTIGGGGITAQALSGSINTGNRANGFLFLPSGYGVDPDLGGISTANGGDVSLSAGQDIISYLPVPGGVQTDGGSGAFGAAPGNVTITAGRDVAGHFVVRNGTGTITAGRDAGTSTRLLALSLVSGGWTVNALEDILLQEVRNPNGIFNNVGFGSSATKHFFDYAPDAYTILNAGNSVQLRGTALPRYTDTFEQGITPIYPGTLEITAGAGGVILGNDVTLFPSRQGNLTITTTEGGSLVGTKPGDLTQLIVSDSGKRQYQEYGDFGIADHAGVPLHLQDPDPISLNIAGDMTSVLLGVPKRTVLNLGGNMINSRFDGQNLHGNDVTSINVTGDVINRNEFTSVVLGSAPNFGWFDLVYPPLDQSLANLPNQFSYNATTRTLTFQGRMTGDQLQTLLNLSVRVLDANGLPVLQPNGEPVTRTVQVISPQAANQLYAESQDIPLNFDTGYRIGGGGQFNFTARNMDLGATVGIVSQGPRENLALANYFTHGAAINVSLSGNLDMFSTKIASLNGGGVSV